jgi:hypothetical protein
VRIWSARSRHERAFLVLFTVTILLINPSIRGDGNGYYAYVRSVVIDHDLCFENEYRRGDPAFVRSSFSSDGRLNLDLQLPNGYVRNQWAVGPAVLWGPFFLVAHALVGLLNLLGAAIPADGYSAPYRGGWWHLARRCRALLAYSLRFDWPRTSPRASTP